LYRRHRNPINQKNKIQKLGGKNKDNIKNEENFEKNAFMTCTMNNSKIATNEFGKLDDLKFQNQKIWSRKFQCRKGNRKGIRWINLKQKNNRKQRKNVGQKARRRRKQLKNDCRLAGL